jgi:HSP20 family protein
MALPVRRHRQPPEWRDPVTEFADLYDRMGELFTWAFSDPAHAGTPAWAPATDLSETKDAYVVDVNLPGLWREDINIEIHGEDLVITGEFKDSGHGGTIRRRARPIGRFECRTTRAPGMHRRTFGPVLRAGPGTTMRRRISRAGSWHGSFSFGWNSGGGSR